jgi:hypothetical protein
MKNIKLYGAIILFLFLIASIVTANVYVKKFKAEKIEKERYKHNYEVSVSYATQIKGENKLLASRIEAQELTIEEIKEYQKGIVADLKDMKISLRKVAGITAFNTETTNNINTLFRDSLRVDSVTIQTLSYHSTWFDIDIVKDGLKANITHVNRDSLINVIHWSREGKFWPTRFLTKKVYQQDIKSMNPDTRITFAKWIVPYKKK